VVVDELEAYDRTTTLGLRFSQRPALVVLNKIDADRETAELVRGDLAAAGWEVLETSAVTGEGVDRLRWRMIELVRAARELGAPPPGSTGAKAVLRPMQAAPAVAVRRSDDGWHVTGEHVERWVRMTDLDNPEALRYLQDRMDRAGVEQALLDAGAVPGDDVEIAGHVFTFEPALDDEPDLDDELVLDGEPELDHADTTDDPDTLS
jgi:GTP-binding protein